MPVEISYLPRPSIFNEPRIWVSLVLRTMLADLIDVSQHLNGAFALQQILKLGVTRTGRGRDPDERHVGRARAASVIHGIADVQQLLAWAHSGDFEQPVRRGFFVLHVVGSDDQEAVKQSFA